MILWRNFCVMVLKKVIDTHYYFITAKNPIPGDEIEITLTTEKPENEDDYDTYLTLQETDDEGSTYLDEVVCDKVWLCPWLQGFFGEVPDEIYIKLYVPNKGHGDIRKSYRYETHAE